MEISVPRDQGDFLAGQVLGHEIFHADQRGLGIGGGEKKALDDFIRNAFAIMMEGAPDAAVSHHVRGLDVETKAVRRAADVAECGSTHHSDEENTDKHDEAY